MSCFKTHLHLTVVRVNICSREPFVSVEAVYAVENYSGWQRLPRASQPYLEMPGIELGTFWAVFNSLLVVLLLSRTTAEYYHLYARQMLSC